MKKTLSFFMAITMLLAATTTLANGTESGTDATTEPATDSDGFINKWY